MALQLEEEENFCYAIQLASSSVLSMSMQSAIELGVFDIIAKAGPGAKLSLSEIAAYIGSGTRNPEAPMMLDRILRLLTSHSILSCSVVANEEDVSDSRRLYSLGPVSRYFVTNERTKHLHIYHSSQQKLPLQVEKYAFHLRLPPASHGEEQENKLCSLWVKAQEEGYYYGQWNKSHLNP